MISQQLKGGKVKWEVKIEATLRQIRDSKHPDAFNDFYTFKSVDGHPPKTQFKVPYFVNGAFANGVGFGDEAHVRCYDYTLSQDSGATLRLRSGLQGSLCGIPRDCAGCAATGIVMHITRSMSPDAARKNHDAVFASIDYAAQPLGEMTLWLPSRVESHDEKGERRMTAIFSNYHRYTGEAKILPGIEELPATDTSANAVTSWADSLQACGRKRLDTSCGWLTAYAELHPSGTKAQQCCGVVAARLSSLLKKSRSFAVF